MSAHIVNILAPVRDYVGTLVHPSAQRDASTAARHRAFIAPRLLGSFAALAAFPVYLALRGVPSLVETLVFVWLVAPILIAYFLSYTGHYEDAHVLSSLALTCLIAAVAAETGGIHSFVATWLLVVPLEAALSRSRRAVMMASIFAVSASILLLLAGSAGLLPALESATGQHSAIVALGIVSASLCATGLALGAEPLANGGLWRRDADDDPYRLLARNMTDVITRHGRGGAVLFSSPAAEPLLGVKAQDLLGHGLFDRIHVADRPAYLTALADSAALGESRSVEFRIRRGCPGPVAAASVEFIWIEMRCHPLDRATAERTREACEVVAVLRDVSERKAREESRDAARAESERANAHKSRFLATMSHELRTPLNVIIGFSEMLIKEPPIVLTSARREEYAQLINESGHHLLSVVNGILDMSKIENGSFEITPELFAPARSIESCCDLLRLKASGAGIELVTRIADDMPQILADKRALNQILLNLLSNAIKFSDRGSRVTASAAADGRFLVLSVEDEGVGIGTDDLSRVGNPFFQARASYDRRHDGTGLGLSIVKGLVTLHGGELDIRSRLGEGTRVTIRLPIDCEHPHSAQSRPLRPHAPVLGTDFRVKKSA